MLHLYFALLIVALLAGVGLMTHLLSVAGFRKNSAFRSLCLIFLIITSCLFITSFWLYYKINIAGAADPRHWITQGYVTYIFAFLLAIPIAISWHKVLLKEILAAGALLYFLSGLQVLFTCLAIVLQYTVAADYLLHLVLFAIFLMCLNLGGIFWLSKKYRHTTVDQQAGDYVALLPVLLPLLEIGIAPDYFIDSGVLLSLPLVYLVHIFLILKDSDQFLIKHTVIDAPINSEALFLLSLLTPKETDVAQAVAKGLSNKEVARELNMSPSTVKNHLYNVFRKCQITNRSALVMALQPVKANLSCS